MTKAKAGGEQPVEIPDTLPILPLRNSVLFPGAIIPIDVGRRKSVRKARHNRRRQDPQVQVLFCQGSRSSNNAAAAADREIWENLVGRDFSEFASARQCSSSGRR